VPRILSLQGLVVAVWVACLALMVLLGGILVGRFWHPHFLPVTLALAVVALAAVGFVAGTSWRIIRGPGRRRALSWLLIGAAPLCFLASFFLYGAAISQLRRWYWLPLPIGALGLVAGAAIGIGMRRGRDESHYLAGFSTTQSSPHA
jgi:hypothetical protein